jgi:hypothetical protein
MISAEVPNVILCLESNNFVGNIPFQKDCLTISSHYSPNFFAPIAGRIENSGSCHAAKKEIVIGAN